MHSAEMRRCLETCDVAGIRALWAHIAPDMPRLGNDTEALSAIHMARTESKLMPLKLRAYSHRWLLDHDLPSSLPDELKPKAERMYPRVVEGVGISVNFMSPIMAPAKPLVQRAMGDAVEACYADGRTDPAFVKAQMFAAKDAEMRRLFG